MNREQLEQAVVAAGKSPREARLLTLFELKEYLVKVVKGLEPTKSSPVSSFVPVPVAPTQKSPAPDLIAHVTETETEKDDGVNEQNKDGASEDSAVPVRIHEFLQDADANLAAALQILNQPSENLPRIRPGRVIRVPIAEQIADLDKKHTEARSFLDQVLLFRGMMEFDWYYMKEEMEIYDKFIIRAREDLDAVQLEILTLLKKYDEMLERRAKSDLEMLKRRLVDREIMSEWKESRVRVQEQVSELKARLAV